LTFLECVTRILRLNGILRGDTDAPTSFSDTNHNASLQLAIVAVQDEIASLCAERLVPYEKTSATIALATGTRSYALATDFVNFFGNPHFYESTSNRIIVEWPGGEENLQLADFTYLTRTGTPNWWYWDRTTSKKVAFYNVPDSSFNGLSLAYQYEKSVLVSAASDTMPFHNDLESNTFSLMAGRRFKLMFENVENKNDVQAILENDVSYRSGKTTLIRLMRGTNAPGYYAPAYR
jgi:hypothetical protein